MAEVIAKAKKPPPLFKAGGKKTLSLHTVTLVFALTKC